MAIPSEALAKTHGLTTPARITEGITGRQVSRVLKDASLEAEMLIARNVKKLGTVTGQVRAQHLKAAIAGLGPISTEMWTGIGKVTQAGMYAQAQLAADQAIDRDMFAGMPGGAIIQYAPQVHFEAAHAVESLISRRTNGFKLAERIYANNRVGVKRAASVVERGLSLQLGHAEIARNVRQFFDPAVPGGVSYAAKRLARTEISNAHHETSIRLSKDRPWVLGFKWNLSGSHPRPDECNQYAEDDHEGMGAGVYSKRNVPSKPHPQCLCYLTHQQEDDDVFIDKLARGQYDPWLDSKGVRC